MRMALVNGEVGIRNALEGLARLDLGDGLD
jgi:hypothetical protein